MCAKVRSADKTQLVKRSSPRIAQQSALRRRESNDAISPSKTNKTGKISFQRTSVHRRQTRNQSGELTSCITRKTVTLQSTTNIVIRGTPKSQHVESKAGTSSNDVVVSSDDDFDYLGRPPSDTQSDSDDESISDESDHNTNNVKQRVGIRKPSQKSVQISEDSDLDSDNGSSDTSEESSEDNSSLVIPQREFQSLVHQIMQQQGEVFHMQSTAWECLQTAAELILVQYFEDINSVAESPKTLMEARLKSMIMDFYLNYMKQNK